MGQGITVTRGYGWVIDEFDGDWVGNIGQFLPKPGGDTVREWVETTLRESKLDVVVDSFGYDFRSLALVARASTADSYDWFHDLATFLPDTKAEAAYRRELLQALDTLEWDEAGLGDPSWLLLVTYG